MTSRADLAQVADTLTATVETNPRDSAAWVNLGETLLKLQQPHDAVRQLTQAYDLNPNTSAIAATLAAAYVQLGDAAMAITWYETALTQAPDDARILRELASLWEKRHKFDEASRTADALLAVVPGDPHGVLIKARIARRNGNLEAALDILNAISPSETESPALAAAGVAVQRVLVFC